jgi:hypothetical protein
MEDDRIVINRAPVLTLWAAVVAERLGWDPDAALSLAKAVAGLNAQAKGRTLGVYGPPKGRSGETPKVTGLGEDAWVQLCGRPVPVKSTQSGTRAVVKDKPIEPAPVRKYLEGKFGESLHRVRVAMDDLAAAAEEGGLEESAYPLYEEFRPAIERGISGWGQAGILDLALLRGLAARERGRHAG